MVVYTVLVSTGEPSGPDYDVKVARAFLHDKDAHEWAKQANRAKTPEEKAEKTWYYVAGTPTELHASL